MADPQAEEFLDDLQGNILRGHGRDFAAHFLLRMIGEPRDVANWIGSFAESVTTALASRDLAAVWRSDRGVGEPFACIALSHQGYRYLGVSDEAIPLAGGAFKGPVDDRYFALGMKNQSNVPPPGRHYNDPPASNWEASYRGDIHALVILADNDNQRLAERIDLFRQAIDGVFEVAALETGRKLKKEFDRGTLVIEHFGYQDGVSQPLMIKQKIEEEVARRGNDHWSPEAPLSLALAPDPAGGYGSFLVFRKLEQNVLGFSQALVDGSAVMGVSPEEVGAMAVGRTTDGIPLVGDRPADPAVDPNDFHFDQDPDGSACPFHAHIRKTNPRGDIARILGGFDAFERARRIVRRGITYGERPDLSDGGPPPSSGVGLLFMCYQSNLDSFIIQQEGSDGNDFVRPGTGVDAVIGQNESPVAQTWPSNGDVEFTMANFVRMLGGEYFFAPSMTFLRSLSEM
ncbi:hypothetical protein [uncultured Roseobacter sp.]|uniref:Dyp-type peroxidase n=1 Tax=uncultured Roseobacter sp. TaxID=114847 RepID=UPI00260DF598|nr:hypothetical protein [uncultured Roseobacter sp.]